MMTNTRKRILLTGGTQGIGEALLHLLAGQDYEVHFTYRSSAQKAEVLCARYPGQVFAYKLDQGDPKAIQSAAFLNAFEWDGVVFNAALGSATVTQYADQGDDFGAANDEAMLKVNAMGPLWIYKAIKNSLLKKDAPTKLVFISSVGGGIAAFPKFTLSDGMSKAAVSFLARQLAAENTQTPIDVFTICPGATETPMFKASSLDHLNADERKEFERTLPKQRLIQASEIAYWVAQLLRPESTVMHGCSIDASMGLGVRPGLMTEMPHH